MRLFISESKSNSITCLKKSLFSDSYAILLVDVSFRQISNPILSGRVSVILLSNRRISLEMKSVKFVFILLTACAVNIEQIFSLSLITTMDTLDNRIDLKDPSSPFFSSGILYSHSGLSYTANRNKTLILSAPEGYSIFAAVQLLDLRPNSQDLLTLFANKTAGPVTYSNIYSYKWREFDFFEKQKSFYAPDGQLGVTFYTGPNLETLGYDGFELLFTVQANLTKCRVEDFWCANGRCISKSFKCDGYNHCGDRSDQNNCYVPDPIQPRSARTAGVVSGVVFLIIAVACAIYITVRRARVRKTVTRRVVSQHPPPTNVQGYPPPYSEPGMIYPPPPPYSPCNQSQGMVNPGYQ